jgi:hypothetical protein
VATEILRTASAAEPDISVRLMASDTLGLQGWAVRGPYFAIGRYPEFWITTVMFLALASSVV